MDSKNKNTKNPAADQNIFNMVRDYCKEPWVSTNKELPIANKFVLMAYYGGEDVGYKTVTGWLHKQVINKKKKDDDCTISCSCFTNVIDVNDSYFTNVIDVNDNYTGNNANLYNLDVLYGSNSYIFQKGENFEKNLTHKYEVIEENGEKVALIWFICSITAEGVFRNFKSADSTFFPDLTAPDCAVKEYSKPDFWMYIPNIK